MNRPVVLDVGTRSIICMDCDALTIRKTMRTEHTGPYMKEGAISDMEGVITGVRKLREEMGLPAGQAAAVAIAGGSLITERHTVKLNGPGPWTPSDLAEAKKIKTAAADQILVGGVSSHFIVDGREVRSLIGLEGGHAQYELLVTYLPLASVRSKILAVARAGFAPVSLTVEPLAVAEAVFGSDVPQGLWAVIDIGAGTSDIALLTPDGIVGASSVPFAGDIITRSIASRLGLGYLDADRIKRDSSSPVKDLWGETLTIAAAQVAEAAEEGVSTVVRAIAKETAKLLGSHKTPLAGVVLVGGGSLWPDLSKRLAAALKMDVARVRLRHAETIAEIVDTTGTVKGPAFLTAIGILRSLSQSQPVIVAELDGRLEVVIGKNRLNVEELLVAAGRDPLEYFGAAAEAIISGEDIIGGAPGESPMVVISGRPSHILSEVISGDAVTVEKGKAAVETAEPPAEGGSIDTRGFISIDGNRVYCGERFRLVDGLPVESEPPVLGAILNLPVKRALRVTINGTEKFIRDSTKTACVNGSRVTIAASVPWDAEIDSSKPRWYFFEALSLLEGPVPVMTAAKVNGVPATFVTEIEDGAAIEW